MVPACLHARFVSHINKDVIGLWKQLSLLAPLRRNFLAARSEERRLFSQARKWLNEWMNHFYFNTVGSFDELKTS